MIKTIKDVQKCYKNRLRDLVAESGKTQVQIAREMGISRKLLNMYLAGSITPNIYTTCRFCEYFGVSADYLLGMSEKREP